MSDKDRYELKIAGLLHDCGKVTTPVHVVDKSTKLETIYDRIHLLDTRFEVVRRDFELEMLKDRAALRITSYNVCYTKLLRCSTSMRCRKQMTP